jgi:uncharacterized Zn finger protein
MWRNREAARGGVAMKCPVCKHQQERAEIRVHDNGFDEELFRCTVCGSTWSVNHGLVEIVRDTQQESFLAADAEAVEANDND